MGISMIDPIEQIRKDIAQRRYELTGCQDAQVNWNIAGKILLHFVHKRPEAFDWIADDEDYTLYRDIVYGDAVSK